MPLMQEICLVVPISFCIFTALLAALFASMKMRIHCCECEFIFLANSLKSMHVNFPALSLTISPGIPYRANRLFNFPITVFLVSKVSKVGDRCRRWPEGSLFNSYYTVVYGKTLPYIADCSTRRYQVPFSSLWYDTTWDWTLVSRGHCRTLHPLDQWAGMYSL